MWHQRVLTGRIANLVVFSLVEFGIRARFKIEGAAKRPVVRAVESVAPVARQHDLHFSKTEGVP